MFKHSEKTVPYRLTPAGLENLLLLRKRMNPSNSIEAEKTVEKSLAEFDDRDPDPGRLDQKMDH